MAAMTACWLLSVRLAPGWKEEGWPALLKSVYGLVWLDWGLDIELRFTMLAWNAVEWGNGSPRLIALPLDTVNSSLLYCAVFWLLLASAYALAVRRRGAGPLTLTRGLDPELAYRMALPVSLISCILFYLLEGARVVPLFLLTPLALLAQLYMAPAIIVWWDHFRRPGPAWRIGSVHLLVLLPALVHGVVSPYRENLSPILLVPLLAAVFAGRRPRLATVVPAGVIALLVLSTVVSSYRQIKWQNARPERVSQDLKQRDFNDWLSAATDEPARRFHGFDSLLLTVRVVPALEPHSGRKVLLSPLLRGVVPRILYRGKEGAMAGITFGSRIWAFDDPVAREQSGASIAPSMPGDLYDAGGVLYVVLGALMFGTLLGLVDGWKRQLPGFAAATVTMVLATGCAMSIERDFDQIVATFIQSLLVLVLVSGVVALVRHGSARQSVAWAAYPERS